MKTIIFIVTLILILAMTNLLPAGKACAGEITWTDETEHVSAADTTISYHSPKPEGKWSVETSLTAPVARIYMAKAGYRITGNSELGFGIGFQNWRNKDVDPAGQSNAWSIILSYRHYLWRNLSVEVELWPAYNHFESFVDGQTYKGFELWVEYRAGYRFDLSSSLSLNVMPGLGHPIWAQQDWPRLVEKSRESPFDIIVFVPQVLIGWRF